MKFNSKKINFKLWLYFTLFAGILMIILWLLQIVFLNSFYTSMKKSEIIKIGKDIKQASGNTEFENIIDETSFKNSILIFITDDSGSTIYSSDEHGFNNRRIQNNAINSIEYRPLFREYNAFFSKMKNTKEDYIIETVKQDRFSGQTLIYGTKMQDAYLFITTPIEAMNSATGILSTQLFYVTTLSLIFSFLIAFFISKKISKPIANITKSASELAKGNYDVKFEERRLCRNRRINKNVKYNCKRIIESRKFKKRINCKYFT